MKSRQEIIEYLGLEMSEEDIGKEGIEQNEQYIKTAQSLEKSYEKQLKDEKYQYALSSDIETTPNRFINNGEQIKPIEIHNGITLFKILDFSVEITKKQKLLEVSNDKCHNWYYLFYGRIYNADKTRMRKFKFVLWFDVFDLQEFYEGQEKIATADIGRFADELGWSTCSANEYFIRSYNDCNDFYDWCNETIDNYNEKR